MLKHWAIIGRPSGTTIRISIFGLLSDFGLRPSAFGLLLALLLLSPGLLSAAERGIADTSASPYAKACPVGLTDVQWATGFWAQRVELCRQKMLPGLWSIMEGTNYSQFYQNFRIAAGLAEGRQRGASFNDGEFYKWLEGACAVWALTRDPRLESRLEEIIGVIAKAQRADGYLDTHVLIRMRNGDKQAKPFQDRGQWEMYNMGHLLTAACIHYRVTGRTNLLAVACKTADFLCETFREPTVELAHQSICPSHYMGMVELYRTTHEPRYLEAVKKFFAMRDLIKDGTDDNQDRLPFGQQTEALGHAVRANYLYAGAADLFAETGDRALWTSLTRIWTNVVEEKMYLTGGCGALFDGASPDCAKNQGNISRVHQAYGRDYQLPNLTAHNETCANIANVMWNWRMFLATGEARFMDVAELALYNSVLSGVGLDGTNFFYVNPLRSVEPTPFSIRWGHTRVPFVGSYCCPPNLTRTLAEVGGYAYSKSPGALWVNLYGSSTLTTTLPGGQLVKVTQETGYPWNGRVRLTINECGAGEWTLKLRIPGWADRATLRLNGQPFAPTPAPGTYAELRRAWQPGERVDLELAMPAQLMEANPLVEEALNQVAVKRGPVVYCLEGCDLPSSVRLQDVLVPSTVDWTARYDQRLLGGVVVLEGAALARPAGDWSHRLYRAVQPATAKPVRLRLIPYFAWANRGRADMSVWLPLAPGT